MDRRLLVAVVLRPVEQHIHGNGAQHQQSNVEGGTAEGLNFINLQILIVLPKLLLPHHSHIAEGIGSELGNQPCNDRCEGIGEYGVREYPPQLDLIEPAGEVLVYQPRLEGREEDGGGYACE